jgi:hypothetical protein
MPRAIRSRSRSSIPSKPWGGTRLAPERPVRLDQRVRSGGAPHLLGAGKFAPHPQLRPDTHCRVGAGGHVSGVYLRRGPVRREF